MVEGGYNGNHYYIFINHKDSNTDTTVDIGRREEARRNLILMYLTPMKAMGRERNQ